MARFKYCRACDAVVPFEEYCPAGHDLIGGSQSTATVHPKERAVVWEHPETGQVRYPGRNDTPMPQRYVDQGYQRKEFETRHSLEAFERQHGVTNDKLWYNSGNTHCSENMREG